MRDGVRRVAALMIALCTTLACFPASALAEGVRAWRGEEGVGEPEGAFVRVEADEYALTAQSDPVLAASSVTWDRLAGSDRYGTMDKIVREGFAHEANAVLATGEDYPDALGASALAGTLGAPILITASNELSVETRALLFDLGVSNVYIVSGTKAVSGDVESSIQDLGASTRRLSGSSRYETNLKVYNAVRGAGSTSNTVIVVSGKGFADALSIAPWAYWSGSPVVLAQKDGTLATEAVKAIQNDSYVQNVLLVGGTAVVSDTVKSQLGSYSYTRLGGANRYETSRDVAAWETSHGLTWEIPAIATGEKYPDALTGAALCGRVGSVLLLGTKASHPAIKLLKQNEDSVVAGNIFGGKASEPLTDPLNETESTGVLLHNVPWMGQPNSYYCGPTCGWMILKKLGAETSAAGASLNVYSVADAMGTSYYGYTSFTDRMFEKGMDSWLGKDVYVTVDNPGYEQIRSAVLHSFDTGYPMVVDEHEHYGGPHFNGHGNGNYSHIMVIDGYNPATDQVLFADPAAEVYWGGGSRKFWYPSLKMFAETYLVPYPWRDGIGMVCPK